MVVVVSWISIVYSFISWELTSQIDVSLNWVLVRDTWGITLLTLVCLCCWASGDSVFALMGSIHSASLIIIIVLTSTRGTVLSFCCFCCCCWDSLVLVLAKENLHCGGEGVFVLCSLSLKASQAPPFNLVFYQKIDQENKIKDFICVIQKSLFTDLTSLTCTLRRSGAGGPGGVPFFCFFYKAPCNWKSAIFWKKDNWFSYTRCRDPVVGLDTVFDFFFFSPLRCFNAQWPQEVKTHKRATLQTFKFTLYGEGGGVRRWWGAAASDASGKAFRERGGERMTEC